MSERLSHATGGVEVVAMFRTGMRETIYVRELPVSLLPSCLRAMKNEAAIVELVCDEPAGWADTLARASFLEILQATDDLNAEFSCKYLAQRLHRQRKAIPNLDAYVTQLAQALLAGNKTIPTSANPTGAATTPQP